MQKDAVILAVKRLATGHSTAKGAAAAMGVSQQYLKDIVDGRREPGPAILKSLGLERVVTYRRVK